MIIDDYDFDNGGVYVRDVEDLVKIEDMSTSYLYDFLLHLVDELRDCHEQQSGYRAALFLQYLESTLLIRQEND